MREKLVIGLLLLAVAMTEAFSKVEAQDVADKTMQILNQARAALGGEKLKSVNSLSAAGSYRRVMGDREMSGELQIDLLMPGKIMRTETLSPMPSMEITRIEALNGDKVWTDQQSSGMGGGMVVIRRPGGDTPQGQAAQQNAIRAEFARLVLGWLLSTPSSAPVEFSYTGEAEAPDGKAYVLDVKGPNGFAAKLFLDQKSHRPLIMTYIGKKPRMITRTMTSGASGHRPGDEEIEKRIKDAEAEAAKQPDVEYQISYSDYREVNGVSLPHRLTRAINGEVNEEWEISKFKVNPVLKAEKFEKK